MRTVCHAHVMSVMYAVSHTKKHPEAKSDFVVDRVVKLLEMIANTIQEQHITVDVGFANVIFVI